MKINFQLLGNNQFFCPNVLNKESNSNLFYILKYGTCTKDDKYTISSPLSLQLTFSKGHHH